MFMFHTNETRGERRSVWTMTSHLHAMVWLAGAGGKQDVPPSLPGTKAACRFHHWPKQHVDRRRP